MASLYNADLKPIGSNVKTQPYQHATKLFVADNLRLAPKQSFLYYVVLNINQSVTAGLTSMIGASTNAISSQSIFEQYEAGLMIKRIDLPKFSISNKTYNAYNRKNIVTNAISYDPISVSFHDDAADVVNKFWNDYYTYYYRDSDYNSELYGVPHKYDSRLRSKWGFTPINRQLIPFLRDIQIFSLHNKRFTEYKLINPIITAWRHGTHDSASNNETMTNSMTIAYETVKYRVGTVNPVDVNGFSILHYDTTPSPISTSTTNIYSGAGLIGAIGTAGSQDLARPDGQGSGRGLFSDILGAYNLYKNIKNIDFRSAAQLTIGQFGASAINGALNGSLTGQIFPTAGGTPGFGVGGSSVVGTNPSIGNSPYPNSVQTTVGGATTTLATGAAISVGGAAISQAQAGVERGLQTDTVQNSPFGPTVGQLGAGIFGIPFNAQTGQPNVGSNQVLTLQNGTFVPSTFSLTSNGFNPGNVNQNLAKPPEIFNGQSGYPVTLRSYADGSSVAFDNNNNVLYTIPAGSQAYTPQQLDQINANAMRSLNVNVETGTRFITNPNTGVVTAVGGTTAVISNGISQTLGAVGGVVAGKKVYETLAKTGLGKSFLGQIVAGGISAGATAGIYRATNNLLQPIVNTGVGAIGQVFDSATRSIRNLTSTWSGTGGYDPKNPTVNLTSKVENPDGSISYNYVDGTQRTLDLDGVQTVTKSGNNAGPGGFWGDEESYVATSPAGAPIVDRNFNSDQTVQADIQSANLSSYDVSSDLY
jgi:hypothetical protein